MISNAKHILKKYESNENHQTEIEEIQLGLFPNFDTVQEHKNNLNKKVADIKYDVIDRISSLDLLNITPMEGFQILYEIQRQLRK